MKKKIFKFAVIIVALMVIFKINPITEIVDFIKANIVFAKKDNSKNEVVMKKGINIGNALEAPKGQPWDVKMDTKYFDDIKKAGFDNVRIPVRFSDYAKDSKDYVLDEAFMAELDSYINYALNNGLVVILDFHHFDELMENPEKYKAMFISVWHQLGVRYKDYPHNLVFELLNEPQKNLKGDFLNSLISDAVKEIRKSNKDRLIMVEPENYSSIDGLDELSLPDDDNLMVSVHYYEPMTFTHQGNPNADEEYAKLKNINWPSSNYDIEYLSFRFQTIKRWADKHKIKVYLGEFGPSKTAPYESRKKWTEAVRKEAEKNGFSWAYWELCSGFGIYDAKTSTWDKDMLNALLVDK